jgi:hypothetical protein
MVDFVKGELIKSWAKSIYSGLLDVLGNANTGAVKVRYNFSRVMKVFGYSYFNRTQRW